MQRRDTKDSVKASARKGTGEVEQCRQRTLITSGTGRMLHGISLPTCCTGMYDENMKKQVVKIKIPHYLAACAEWSSRLKCLEERETEMV